MTSFALQPREPEVAALARSGVVRVWHLKTGHQLLTMGGGVNKLTTVQFSPNGLLLATAEEHTIQIREASSGRILRELQPHGGAIRFLVWDYNGDPLLSGGEHGVARMWNVRSGHCVHVLKGHRRELTGGAISNDGRFIVTASGDGTGRMLDCDELTVLLRRVK